MQAYARAELVPLEPGFDEKPSRACRSDDDARRLAAGDQLQSAASAVAALLLEGLDDEAAAALASQLAPHILRQTSSEAAVPHVAYTVASLAEELAVSPKAIRCAITRGELRGVKRGSRWIISAAAVEEWARASKSHRTEARWRGRGAPKAAGPSLRAVLCDEMRGVVR